MHSVRYAFIFYAFLQEILDCCGDRDSCGNNPAIQYPYRIMDCMIKLYEGLEKDEDYPYEARYGECRF
uniref:Uncharacterized protein n=1 Tax=Acrobeloides nanus TaxID=290746 RepID=A0A914EFI0_9BILA